MKKLILTSVIAIACIVNSNAQTQPSTPQQSFFDTVSKYFTSFNTNLTTFTSKSHAEISMGLDTVNNDTLTASFLVEAPVWKSFSLEANVRNRTVFGDITTAGGGVGYSIVKWDTKLTGFVDGGYDWTTKRSFVEPGIRIKKALTENTYAGVGISIPFGFNTGSKVITPSYSVFSGFRF